MWAWQEKRVEPLLVVADPLSRPQVTRAFYIPTATTTPSTSTAHLWWVGESPLSPKACCLPALEAAQVFFGPPPVVV